MAGSIEILRMICSYSYSWFIGSAKAKRQRKAAKEAELWHPKLSSHKMKQSIPRSIRETRRRARKVAADEHPDHDAVNEHNGSNTGCFPRACWVRGDGCLEEAHREQQAFEFEKNRRRLPKSEKDYSTLPLTCPRWFQTFFIFTPTWENDPIWLLLYFFSDGLKPPTISASWFFTFFMLVDADFFWSTL